MRLPAALLATFAAMPAFAGASYSSCVESTDPAACIARRAVESGVEPNGTLDEVIRHGLVDLIPSRSREFQRGLRIELEDPETLSTTETALLAAPRKSLLAAVALAAAARHEIDPFSNPIYRDLARRANNDRRIPALALGLWVETVGFGGRPEYEVTHVGLPAVWERAVARKEQDTVLLEDIAGDFAHLHQLLPQTRQFYGWLMQRPRLTPAVRVGAASSLGRYFGEPELAVALLNGIDHDVGGYDIHGVRVAVAAARLAKGYDGNSARLVRDAIREKLADYVAFYSPFGPVTENNRDMLERAHARDELRDLGAESLHRAEAAPDDPESVNWYAAASDFYLRAGDRELAREVARRGLPLMPVYLRHYLAEQWSGDWSDVEAMALATGGKGTSPVIALYRSGAIDEALQTRALIGNDRYLNAERAGEKKDPQWAIDDTSTVDIAVMVHEAARSSDRHFQQRAYDGLVRRCRKPLADCFSDTLLQIAEVAAGMGDEQHMKDALGAAAHQLDSELDIVRAFRALSVAGPWAHCEEVLRNAH